MIPLWILLSTPPAVAAEFDWVDDFNIRAEADPSGFRARIEARFLFGDVAIRTVFSNIERPSDAYIVLRLGEISGLPIDHIVTQYKSGNGKGWGVLAKDLGIKPGSLNFHVLKQSQDLYFTNFVSRNNGKGNLKNKGKGKGRN